MKNKKLAYFLIPAVIMIWGTVIINVIAYYHGCPEESLAELKTLSKYKTLNISDTFSLILDYPDPFLSSAEVIKTKVSTGNHISISQKATNPSKPIEKNISWPAIKYGGVIKNKSSLKACGFVKIGTSDYIMSAGDTQNDVYIKAIYRDSIVVSYKNILKTIIK
jgi:hypothetical protein